MMLREHEIPHYGRFFFRQIYERVTLCVTAAIRDELYGSITAMNTHLLIRSYRRQRLYQIGECF